MEQSTAKGFDSRSSALAEKFVIEPLYLQFCLQIIEKISQTFVDT